MNWFKQFPYKWQIADIILGFCAIVCSCVFFLISVGLPSSLWRTMALTLACIGALCTVTGAVWCCWAVKQSRLNPDFYSSKPRENEVTWTSEATEMLK